MITGLSSMSSIQALSRALVRVRTIRSTQAFNLRWQHSSSSQGENSEFIHEPQTSEPGILYDTHVPTSPLQKLILGGGSSLVGLANPWRADMVAVSGEVTGIPVLPTMLQQMMRTEEGQQVMEDRPRINKGTIDSLSELPETTVGGKYYRFMTERGLSPDAREPVRYVDDPDLAYVMTRYRETHDITHAVLGIHTNLVGELLVKWVEGLQTGLPMCVGAAIFGPLRFKTDRQRTKYSQLLPWAIRVGHTARFLPGVYYEKRWEQDIEDFWREMNIEPPPHLTQDGS